MTHGMTTGHTAMAVGLALGAAACFALSNVAQMDAVGRQPSTRPVEAGLLVKVARDPLWLAGLAASVVGYALEAIALSVAPVVLVQPLIVAELPIALTLAASISGRRLSRVEWTGIALVTASLIVGVAVIRPEDNPIVAGPAVWAMLFAVICFVVAALLAVGRRAGDVGRTSAFAAAAGAAFGLLAVVTKATTHQFQTRGFGALGTWQPWALAAIGIVGMTLAQNTYRAGPLAVSLPLLDIGEPLAASVIAMGAFGEQLGHLGVGAWVALALSALGIVTGIAVLDRSPLVRNAHPEQAPSPPCPTSA